MFNFLSLFKFFKPKYKSGDFVLTKPFISAKGESKGNLVLRIEHCLNDSFLCSKGRFELKLNPVRREWVFDNGQKLIQISSNNIQKKLSLNQAYNALEERIRK